MRPTIGFRASAGFVAWAAAIALPSPVLAQPNGPIPGTGIFRVGIDIAPGTYQSQGPADPLIDLPGNVPPISFCSWSTHGTAGAADDDIVDADRSLGPMVVSIPETVVAFKTQNCRPWTRA